MFYAIFSHGRSTIHSMLLLLFTVLLAIFITAYYHYLQNPVFHQNTFSLLTAIAVFRSIYSMETTLRSSIKPKQGPNSSTKSGNLSGEDLRAKTRDMAILRKMWKIVACGLSAFAGGFLIWNLDSEFCSTLRSWRREIGLPWGILSEGHGCW